MRLLTVVGSLLVAGAWSVPLEAQSLGALARSSPRVRKTSAKVYTEADLAASRGQVNFTEPAEPGDAAEAGEPEGSGLPPLDLYGTGVSGASDAAASAEPSEEEARAQRLAELKRQVEVENKVIAVVHEAMNQAVSELNDLTSLTYGGRRAYLMKIVEDGQKELANSQQVIADLEEKARREGLVLSR